MAPSLIVRALVFGGLLAMPMCVQSRISIDRRRHGEAVVYRGRHGLRNMICGLAMMIGVMLLVLWYADFQLDLVAYTIWPFAAFAVAWIATRIFTLVYVLWIERRVGSRIIENRG